MAHGDFFEENVYEHTFRERRVYKKCWARHPEFLPPAAAVAIDAVGPAVGHDGEESSIGDAPEDPSDSNESYEGLSDDGSKPDGSEFDTDKEDDGSKPEGSECDTDKEDDGT